MTWQSRFGGRQWKVTSYGVLSRGPETGEEEAHRTDGQPLTVTRYLYHWGAIIHRVSRQEGVPVDIILATLATENGPAKIVGGSPLVRPIRKELGYVSDHETPHRISVGPCHVLISTARAAMGSRSIDRAWLEDLENNLRAACRYLSQQDRGWRHGWDPILVAASYNAGGIYDASDPGSRFHNRWHIRSYGNHLDRFANWYGDAAYVWRDQVTEPPEDPDIPAPRLREIPAPEPTGKELPETARGPVRPMQKALAVVREAWGAFRG